MGSDSYLVPDASMKREIKEWRVFEDQEKP